MKYAIRRLLLLSCGVCWATPAAAQHLDVLTQVVNGKIAIGAADYDDNTWTVSARVFGRQLLSNFRANDPGFTGLATGNVLLGSGVSGFPSNYDVFFDLLPMRIGLAISNLFFWNGADSGGDGLALNDVQFVAPPAGVTWNIFDDGFNLFTANATDAFVPGGLVQQTSSDTNPGDGIDTGTLHSHLLIRVDDGDGNTRTTPPQGVYLAALQLRAANLETSEPFLFVHRTSTQSNEVRDLAAMWAEVNYDSLFSLPGDYDRDGAVDGNDLLVWQRALGAVGVNPFHAADGDGSGIVDAADFVIWSSNFGAVGPAATSRLLAVPEPATGGILWLATVAIAQFTARRPR